MKCSGAVPATPAALPGSRAAQVLALVLAVAGVAALGWDSDGLWFQGDSPRHAATGLFMAELLREWPRDPVAFALAYYARYPVIVPLLYPPVFHLLEGLLYLVLPPTPWVGKGLVLAFAGLAGLYALAWGRRWISPMAGWSGALAVLAPGAALYANAVMLNLPATALGLGALYHLRRWLESGRAPQFACFVGCVVLAVLTHYVAVLVLPVALACALVLRRPSSLVPLAVLTLALPAGIVLLSGSLSANLLRNLPSPGLWLQAAPWVFYAEALVGLAGGGLLACALAGLLAAALGGPAYRKEAALITAGLAAHFVVLVLLPAQDERYALLMLPLLALAAVLGPLVLAGRLSGPAWAPLAASLVVGVLVVQGALSVRLTALDGFEQLSAYLRRHGPDDAVLYAGRHEGLAAFHLLADDPGFQRRMVLAQRLLYRLERGQGFERRQESLAATPEAVVEKIEKECGCQWVAVEVRPQEQDSLAGGRELRQALQGASFEHVASFAVRAPLVPRIDLYRVVHPGPPAAAMDIDFPFFGDLRFPGISPVATKTGAAGPAGRRPDQDGRERPMHP